MVDGDKPHPLTLGSIGRLPLEGGDKPHLYTGSIKPIYSGFCKSIYTRFRIEISKRRENLLSASERHTLSNPRLSERSEGSLGDFPPFATLLLDTLGFGDGKQYPHVGFTVHLCMNLIGEEIADDGVLSAHVDTDDVLAFHLMDEEPSEVGLTHIALIPVCYSILGGEYVLVDGDH